MDKIENHTKWDSNYHVVFVPARLWYSFIGISYSLVGIEVSMTVANGQTCVSPRQSRGLNASYSALPNRYTAIDR
jgi:hypothetical protein